jgi:hypothetical protein
VYWFARERDYHNKHLDYRALAEGLRVQLFWKLAGLKDEVSDHYLRKQRTELEWVREALRTQLRLADWGMVGAVASPSSQAPLEAIDKLVLPRWVEDQRTFFANAAQRDRHKIERRELWAVWLLVAGLVAGAVVVAGQLSASNSTSSNWQHVLIVLMGFAPAIAAAMGGYADKMVFASQAKRYLWMAELFARAEARLRNAVSAGNLAAAQVLIAELGNEALGENGDWVLMHRERPPEAPKGA